MDHSHMNHGDMDMGHGGMDMGNQCKMNMVFTWNSENLCIVFPGWRITSTMSLLLSLVAIVAIVAGYEALRSASRRYEESVAKRGVQLPSEYLYPKSFRVFFFLLLKYEMGTKMRLRGTFTQR